MSLFKAVEGYLENGGEGLLQPEPDVGRTRLRFGEFVAGSVAQPGPAARTAAINAQK